MARICAPLSLLTFLALSPSAARALVDPSPEWHTISLTFHRHVDTPMSAERLNRVIAVANDILQHCEKALDWDVACAIRVQAAPRSGLGTFGDHGDGHDLISNELEEEWVLSTAPRDVAFVTQLPGLHIGVIGHLSGTILIGLVDPNGFVLSDGQLGQVLAHELGHAAGLHDVDPPQPGRLMNYYQALGEGVTESECAAFHSGPLSVARRHPDGVYRPVDDAYVIDVSESMSDKLDAVKSAIRAVFDQSLSTDGPCDLVRQLTTFRDIVLEAYLPQDDLIDFLADIDGMAISPGPGLCGEASLEAITQAAQHLQRGGRMSIATDEPPLAPLTTEDLDYAIATLRRLGITVYSLVEQSACEYGARVGFAAPETQVSSRDVFTRLSEETGGLAYVTGLGSVNMVNALRNIVSSSMQPSLIVRSPEPGAGIPRDSHWKGIVIEPLGTRADGEVTLSSPGALFRDIAVLDDRTIAASVSTVLNEGRYDLTAVVTHPNGSRDTCLGVGALEVTSAYTGGRISSVSPVMVGQGDTIVVRVDGVNTHFDSESSAQITPYYDPGPVLEVISTTVVTPRTLLADVYVDCSAPPGLYRVTVTTGSETVSGGVTVAATPLYPEMLSVNDVAGDEGGAVLVRWRHSVLDGGGGVSEYQIVRFDSPARDTTVATVAATGMDEYTAIVPTVDDSSSIRSECSEFAVVAVLDSAGPGWISNSIRGCSFDNLGPQAPQGLGGSQESDSVGLSWNRSPSPDVCVYDVYGGNEAGETLLGTTSDTTFNVAASDGPAFRVEAIDVHENHGASATWNAVTGVEVEVPPRPGVGIVWPNPAGDMPARVEYWLDVRREVRGKIVDPMGRLVRVLSQGVSLPGKHVLEWDLHDQHGNLVRSGIYWFVLVSDGWRVNRPIVVVR